MVDAFAAPNPLQDPRLFMLTIRRNQRQDRLADDFISGVAEEPFGGCVPTGDDDVESLADDGVIGRLDDSGESVTRYFTAVAIGNVAQVGGENRPVNIAQRRYVDLDQDLSSVRAQGFNLEAFAQHRAFSSRKVMLEALAMSFPKVWRNNKTG